MAHPKTRVSKTRRDKRRTHHKCTPKEAIAICKTTGESHLYHRAYFHEGNLYFKGQKIVEFVSEEEENDEDDD